MKKPKKLLTTEDIKAMSLKEFMAFRQNRHKAFPMSEICKANRTGLIVSDLEVVDSIKKLKQLTAQLKEDLWWDIQSGKTTLDEY